ncbi:hypothetical protein [Mycobacterium shimoidei]|uniref:hypothetical protein n=1 Tax=Mycobacterium shimoidei TaxID=29313 RepID=UPI00111C8456|nr:hypothetical protein [Mycobacterium shimoidei]MCV7258061.1 hypothetical protein [Mycobacterium shimoidei]
MTRRLAMAVAYLLAVSCLPFVAVVGSASEPRPIAACDDTQPDCQDTTCTSDDCAAPPPPVVVPGRGPRPDINACVNLGGRRRVSVNGCI